LLRLLGLLMLLLLLLLLQKVWDAAAPFASLVVRATVHLPLSSVISCNCKCLSSGA
jgi:hypothetical protein